jgi:hypothetical protein
MQLSSQYLMHAVLSQQICPSGISQRQHRHFERRNSRHQAFNLIHTADRTLAYGSGYDKRKARILLRGSKGLVRLRGVSSVMR